MNAKAKIQAQLSAYLDGELDEAQLRQVEEALEDDGGLRAELADLSAARRLLRDLPAEKPSADLVSRVLAEAERSQLVGGQATESSPSPLRWIRYAASAAVLLVAATVGMVIAVTLCSPEIYKDDLSRHSAPDIRDDEKTVAVAGGKREGRGLDLDGDSEKLGRRAARSLVTEGTTDGRESKERGGVDLSGGGGPGGHGVDGKLGTLDDNGRSRALVLDGPSVSDKKYEGDTTTGAGTLAWAKSGTVGQSGGNRYTGGATVSNGSLTKSGNGAVTIGDTVDVIRGGDLSGGVAITGVTDRGGDHWKGALAKGQAKNDADAASGPFDNVKNMSRVLAGNTANNTVIYTDRLDQTQRQVEKVLGANGVVSAVSTESEPAAANKTGGEANRARGNFYVANTLSPVQVQYEAYVTPEQMAKVQEALDRVRARQNVSQDVPALAYNEASAKDGGWGYTNGQAGYFAGKESEKPSGLAIAKVDGDRTFGRRVAPADMPVAPGAAPAAPAAVPPAPAGETASGASAAAPGTRAAKPLATPALVLPAAKSAPPAPVVVATGRTSGEEAGQKAKQDEQDVRAARPDAKLGKATHKNETQLVQASAQADGQLAKAPDKDKTQLAEAPAKDEAQRAKLPESRPGSAVEYRGPSADDLLKDTKPRREVAQTSPATPGEKLASEVVANQPTPSVAAKPARTPAPNQAAKTADGLDRDRDYQLSTRPQERLAGQVAGPIGGQRAHGVFNPPTTSPASAPATTWQQKQVVQAPPAPATAPGKNWQEEQVVRVGIVKASPPTNSGGTVAVQIISQRGQASQLFGFDNTATARVQRLLITLNYRQAGEDARNLERARLDAAAASQAATSQAAPAANRAAQEAKQQENQTQSK